MVVLAGGTAAVAQVAGLNPMGSDGPEFAGFGADAPLVATFRDADGAWSVTAYRSKQDLLCVSAKPAATPQANDIGCANGFVVADNQRTTAPAETSTVRTDPEHVLLYGSVPADTTAVAVQIGTGESAAAQLTTDAVTIPVSQDQTGLTAEGQARLKALGSDVSSRAYIIRIPVPATTQLVRGTLTLTRNGKITTQPFTRGPGAGP